MFASWISKQPEARQLSGKNADDFLPVQLRTSRVGGCHAVPTQHTKPISSPRRKAKPDSKDMSRFNASWGLPVGSWFSHLARTTRSWSYDQTPTLIPKRALSGDSHLASCQALLHRKCPHPRGSSGCSDNLDGAVWLPLHPTDPAFMFQSWFLSPQTAGAPHSHGWFIRLFREVYFCKDHVICEAYGRREL